MDRKGYIRKIAETWAEHANAADKIAKGGGDIYEESVHAFLANAINAAILKSKHRAEYLAAMAEVES